MTFPEFLDAYRTGEIVRDATWRAYDIETAVRGNIGRTGRTSRGKYVEFALKRLGLKYAGELAIPEFCARYGVDPETAPLVLGSWWLWSGIDAGRAMGVPKRVVTPTG